MIVYCYFDKSNLISPFLDDEINSDQFINNNLVIKSLYNYKLYKNILQSESDKWYFKNPIELMNTTYSENIGTIKCSW